MQRAVLIVRKLAVKPDKVVDTITLDHQDRHRRRMAMKADGGLEFLLDLGNAAVLEDGDALKLEDGALVRVKDGTGRELTVRQFFFSEAARQRRNFAPVERQLLADGALRKARVGNTRLLSVGADDVVTCARTLIERGPGIYK